MCGIFSLFTCFIGFCFRYLNFWILAKTIEFWVSFIFFIRNKICEGDPKKSWSRKHKDFKLVCCVSFRVFGSLPNELPYVLLLTKKKILAKVILLDAVKFKLCEFILKLRYLLCDVSLSFNFIVFLYCGEQRISQLGMHNSEG